MAVTNCEDCGSDLGDDDIDHCDECGQYLCPDCAYDHEEYGCLGEER